MTNVEEHSIRTLIFGVTGYTGMELIRLLSTHPRAVIVGGSSRNWAGQRVDEVFPFIPAAKSFPLTTIEELLLDPQADLAFLALPHGESAGCIRPLLDAGLKVVDLSADCRLEDEHVYAKWYGPHKDPDLLSRAVYGLPEIYREAIATADLVANPGCYPTTVILGLAPLMNDERVDCTRPIVDSKSGISGAGRGAKLNTSFCEAGEGFKPYGVTRHRHIPEMEQELGKLAGQTVKVRFTPHLIPVSRGMVSTIYVPVRKKISTDELRDLYADRYRNEPFVTLLPKGAYPDTARVRGSNQCHVSVEVDERTDLAIVMTGLDNLTKGASGCAVQNMNIMMGLADTEGLAGTSLFP
ncbi:MAG: N-acetyl-gamma-glutamyl-phosphate reductase [Desulfomonilaceae bacterium]|nr:N-acetyl-gamma-glutamyl-phosphate reductase [Desulfomonilaceae bacterium]